MCAGAGRASPAGPHCAAMRPTCARSSRISIADAAPGASAASSSATARSRQAAPRARVRVAAGSCSGAPARAPTGRERAPGGGASRDATVAATTGCSQAPRRWRCHGASAASAESSCGGEAMAGGAALGPGASPSARAAACLMAPSLPGPCAAQVGAHSVGSSTRNCRRLIEVGAVWSHRCCQKPRG